MTDINAAARENAREETGRFGVQAHSTPEVSLSVPYVPGQPVYATISFEEYASAEDDHPVDVHTQKVDISAILDAMPLKDINTLRDNTPYVGDDIVHTLQQMDELTHPSFPFEVRFGEADLDAYADYREANGQTNPLAEKPAPSVENLSAVRSAQKNEVAQLYAQLAELETANERTEARILGALAQKAVSGASQIVVQLDHPKYPVEVYDADGKWVDLGEEGEKTLVEEIRSALGEDSGAVGGRGTARVVDIDEA